MVMPSIPWPLNALLSLFLAALVGLVGLALGDRLLRWLGIRTAGGAERAALAGALGLGALAYGFLALGLIGLLRPLAVWLLLALVAAWSWPQMRRWSFDWRARWAAVRPEGLFQQVGLTLILAMVAVVLLRGLAPVTDYDGLTYHLVVPRQYLQAGRIFAVPGEAHANFPLTVDLLFLPAISLGLESAARLIHLGFGLLMGLGVWGLAGRITGSQRGRWLALFALGTTLVLGTVGGYAHTDLGWALFEFLAAYAVLAWTENDDGRWLLLAGILAGLGLGSKYLGLPVLGVLGLVVLIHSGLLVRRPWRRVVGEGLTLGAVAVLVGLPWYAKNWLALGNPTYPLWFGGRGWDEYLAANLQFMGSHYGPHRGLLGYLLLPLDLFRYSIGYFGPVPFAFPTPLSLLLPLYLFVRRRRVVSLLLLVALLRFGTWAVSARNARYLMDIYPLLAVAVAYLLIELDRKGWLRVAVQVLVLALLTISLAWQVLLLAQEDPFPVVLGLESKDAYLSDHNQPPYRAIRFLNGLPGGSRVLFVGNGQGYYATVPHVADADHGNWGHLVYLWGEEPQALRAALADQGITHVYYSAYDFEWRTTFDTEAQIGHELAVFERFAARCAIPVYDGAAEAVDAADAGLVYRLLDHCEE